MKRLFFIIPMVLLYSMPSLASDLTLLSDVDMVDISCYEKDGILRVDVFYKNRSSDQLIPWKEGSVVCECTAYHNTGNVLRPMRGEEIGYIHQQVTRFSQGLYIDLSSVPAGDRPSGVLECRIDTGYDVFTATNLFLIHH